ncbi:TPA: hypothetical protein ACYLN4_000248 [Burkholderia lata]
MTKRIWILADPAKLVPPGKINMSIDSEILDELVRAGMGKDFSGALDTALRLSRLLASYKDEQGNVYVHVQNKQKHDELDYDVVDVVVVHAFEATR